MVGEPPGDRQPQQQQRAQARRCGIGVIERELDVEVIVAASWRAPRAGAGLAEVIAVRPQVEGFETARNPAQIGERPKYHD
jgi:hypothetical protein